MINDVVVVATHEAGVGARQSEHEEALRHKTVAVVRLVSVPLTRYRRYRYDHYYTTQPGRIAHLEAKGVEECFGQAQKACGSGSSVVCVACVSAGTTLADLLPVLAP